MKELCKRLRLLKLQRSIDIQSVSVKEMQKIKYEIAQLRRKDAKQR